MGDDTKTTVLGALLGLGLRLIHAENIARSGDEVERWMACVARTLLMIRVSLGEVTAGPPSTTSLSVLETMSWGYARHCHERSFCLWTLTCEVMQTAARSGGAGWLRVRRRIQAGGGLHASWSTECSEARGRGH